MRRIFGWGLCLVFAVGCGPDDPNGDNQNQTNQNQNQTNQNQNQQPQVPMLLVADQDLELTTVVVVESLSGQEEGYLAVRDGSCESPGGVLGALEIPKMGGEDLEVPLMEPAASRGSAAEVCVTLFEGGGSFDIEEAQAVEVEGDVVEETITVTAGEGTPDIRISIASQGSLAYTLVGIEPAHFSEAVDDDPESSNDIRFNLRPEWRYELVNTVTNAHPFEFRAADQTVQLAQGSTGALEGESSIQWDHQESVMRFTVSEEFQAGIARYRCAPHLAMEGPVEYLVD